MTLQARSYLASFLLHAGVLGACFLLMLKPLDSSGSRRSMDFNVAAGAPDAGALPDAADSADRDGDGQPDPPPEHLETADDGAVSIALTKKPPAKALPRNPAPADDRINQIRKNIKPASRRNLTAVKALARTMLIGAPRDVGAISSRIDKGVRNRGVSVGTMVGSGNGAGSGLLGGDAADSFASAVSAQLHERWNQPSRSEVGKAQPRATITLTVRADGTVTVARIVTPSGNAVMDASIEVLLRDLKVLPAPSGFGLSSSSVTLTPTFGLESDE